MGWWRSRSWRWCPGPPPSQSAGDGVMGHPPKHTFSSVPTSQASPLCHHPGTALPWHQDGQGFAWHGGGGGAGVPRAGAAPPLPESPAGCGCERQVRAGEGCLEFVSRSRERQEQILIINNPAGWRLCRQREGGRQRPVAKRVWGESGQQSFIASPRRGVSGTHGVPRSTSIQGPACSRGWDFYG